MRKKGYINIYQGAFYRNNKNLDQLNFHTIQQKVIHSYEQLLDGLVQFVRENYNLDWHQDFANDMLVEYLQQNQVRLLNFLFESQTLEQIEGQPLDIEPKYVIAKFIENLQITRSSKLDFLETVIKGNMLANALFLTEPGSFQRNFVNTVIYLDAPLVIYALGYAGAPREKPIIELIELIRQYHGSIKVFKHSLEEIIGILNACANKIRRNDLDDVYGPSMEFFIIEGFSETDILMLIQNLIPNLASMGIEVVDKPTYDDYSNVIGEEDFISYIKERIPYKDDTPVERDKDSIAAMHRIRKGQNYFIIEECKALFITLNTSLAYCARTYPDFNTTVGSVPLVMTDYELTNLLWLKNPSICPTLPRRIIIADSYAAVQPSNRLWARYLKSIEKLEEEDKIDKDQYFLLRYSIQARSELMDRTRGDESVFSDGTVQEIIDSVTKKIRAKDVEKINEVERERREAIQSYEDERERLISLQEKVAYEREEKEMRIENKARKIAENYRKVFAVALSILFLTFSYFSSPYSPVMKTDKPSIINFVGYFAFISLLILEFFDNIFNININFIFNWIEKQIYILSKKRIQKAQL